MTCTVLGLRILCWEYMYMYVEHNNCKRMNHYSEARIIGTYGIEVGFNYM